MATNEVAIIEQLGNNGMEKAAAQKLLDAYGVPFVEAGKILNDYPLDEEGNISLTDASIVVNGEDDTDNMAKARTTRLALRQHRIEIEKKHDELKADSLAYGKAVDLVQRHALEKIKPVEQYLQLQEKYAETKQEERRQARLAERTAKLTPYVDDVSVYNYADMGDDAFELLLDQVKDAHEKKIAAEKAAAEAEEKERREREEADRVAREKAEAELADERKRNEKKLARISQLSQFGFAFNGNNGYKLDNYTVTEKQINDSDDADWDQTIANIEVVIENNRVAAEKAAAEKAEADKIEADRVAKLEAEAKAKREADELEAKRVAAEKEAAEKAAAAPDKDKLLAYVDELGSVLMPEVTTEKADAIESRIAKHLSSALEAYRKLINEEL